MSLRRVFKTCATFARHHTPWLYDSLIKLLSSDLSRTIRNSRRLPRENRIIAENRPRFAVNIGQRCGIGALMSAVAEALAYCDDEKLLPRFIFTNPLYAAVPGENWLAKYFVVHGPAARELGEIPLPRERYVMYSINLLRRFRPSIERLTLLRMHQLFTSAISFRPELVAEAEQFCIQNEIGAETLGVHFRGTDKRLEASFVPWKELGEQIKSSITSATKNVFVATDEPDFLKWMREEFPAQKIIDLDCKEIYAGGAPAHLTAGDPDVKAREAIQTILVLTHCGLLIRTRSNLSAWSKILKPSLPVIVFGTMRGVGFPENLIQTDAPGYMSGTEAAG